MCVAGRVGLNLVCNDRLVREGMFNDVFLPPYRDDNGITVGCYAYRLFGNQYAASSSASLASSISLEDYHEDEDRDDLENANDEEKDSDATTMTTTATTETTPTTMKGKDLPPPPPHLWDSPLYPYLGPSPNGIEMAEAIRAASPWLDIKKVLTTPNPPHQK